MIEFAKWCRPSDTTLRRVSFMYMFTSRSSRLNFENSYTYSNHSKKISIIIEHIIYQTLPRIVADQAQTQACVFTLWNNHKYGTGKNIPGETRAESLQSNWIVKNSVSRQTAVKDRQKAARTLRSDSFRLNHPLPMSLKLLRTWFLAAVAQLSQITEPNAWIALLCIWSNSSSRHDFIVSDFRNPARGKRMHSVRSRCNTCSHHTTSFVREYSKRTTTQTCDSAAISWCVANRETWWND